MIAVKVILTCGKNISLLFRGDTEIDTGNQVVPARFLKYISEIYLDSEIVVFQKNPPDDAPQNATELSEEKILWLPPFNLMAVLSAMEQGEKIFHNNQELDRKAIYNIALTGGIRKIRQTLTGLEITIDYLQ